MIQRVQSLYLTLVLLLSLLCLFVSILHFTGDSGETIKLMVDGTLTSLSGQAAGQVENIWPITAILILIPVLSLITIFLFKNRKIQLIMAVWITIASVGLIITLIWYGLNVADNFKMKLSPSIQLAVPFLILLFSVLAYRGILKDDRLVRSYDRLR